MISELEMNQKNFVRRYVKSGRTVYQVLIDNKVIFETPYKHIAYNRMRDEKEKIEIDEVLYDTGIKINPEVLLKKQIKARQLVKVINPSWNDFPIAWKVYYGPVLIGSFKSSWEAEQYKEQVILEGGY